MSQQAYYTGILLDLEGSGIEVLNQPIRKEPYKGILCKIVPARQTATPSVCPRCGSMSGKLIKHGTKRSLIKLLKVTGYPTYLDVKKQRYLCQECHQTFIPKTSLVDRGCFLSKPLKTAIILAAQEIRAEKSLGKDYGVSHQTVHRLIHQKAGDYPIRKEYLPSFLSIDEFKSVKASQGAMSFVFCDSLHKELIDVVIDRRLDHLIKYFHQYEERARKNVKAVVIDMYDPYIQLTKTCFPKASLVIDKFHLVQHLSRALNQTRIGLMKRYKQDELAYKLLKKHWKLILSKRSDLKDTLYWNRTLKMFISSFGLMQRILALDADFKRAWMAYQDICCSLQTRDEKRFFLWLEQYRNTLSPQLNTVLNTFEKYREYIRNTFRTSLNNGVIEGMNHKIKLIKRVSFGYRSFWNLRTRIMLTFTLTKKQPDVVTPDC